MILGTKCGFPSLPGSETGRHPRDKTGGEGVVVSLAFVVCDINKSQSMGEDGVCGEAVLLCRPQIPGT